MKQLLIIGNSLLFVGKDYSCLYPLDKYVVQRNSTGRLSRIIVCEEIERERLPEDVALALALAD
ncbi:hypothetical protein [Candidatus Enterovibrio escicola]|uniref:hypothetical protein n=1 Tax=Candidatus Enterovibrio escicola TaxID=1927127 RepID=UPI001237D19C|nr:hypothetical protein [Candidatus Enterovibrio escacola]